MDQGIGFCTTPHGVRIAYATVGTGPPLVIASPGISHLELDWEEPRIRNFWETIGQHHTVVRYDRHGCGLSDRNRSDFSLDSEIRPIDAVVKELGLKSFVLWGQTHGGAPAIAYAAKFPDRISRLILCGTHARSCGGAVAKKNTYRELVLLNWRMASLALMETMLGSSVRCRCAAMVLAPLPGKRHARNIRSVHHVLVEHGRAGSAPQDQRTYLGGPLQRRSGHTVRKGA